MKPNEFRTFYKSINPYKMSEYDKTEKIVSAHINPSIMEERELHVTQMDVFSRLMMDRIIFLGTEVTSETMNILSAQLLFLDQTEPGRDINLYLNTPGGSVSDGLMAIDTMNYITSDVAITVTGMAASMGAVFLASGTKGKRSALPHSRVMIHQPMGGCEGQAKDMEITVKEINKLKTELYTILANGSGKTIEEITRDADRDFWLTAPEAKEYGLLDLIVEKRENKK